jgi:hypothetical protein
MDKAWAFLFALITALAALLGLDMRNLGLFLILFGALVLPFIVEIYGILTESAKARFYSWAMTILCIIALGVLYWYGGIVLRYLKPVVVPSFIDLFNFALIFSTVDTLGSYFIMYISLSRLIRYFRTYLAEEYRDEIPLFQGKSGLKYMLLFIFYLSLEYVALWYLLRVGCFLNFCWAPPVGYIFP